MPTSLEMRQERAKLVKDAQEILKAESVSAEDEARADKLMDAADVLKSKIDREERVSASATELREIERPGTRPATTETRDEKPSDDEYREAYGLWLRGGISRMPAEKRAIVEKGFVMATSAEERALAASTNAAGGYTVPQGFYDQLIEAQKQYGGMRMSRATVLQTESGQTLPIPTDDDTANVGVIVNENTVLAEQDVTFGQKSLGAYMYTSKIVRVSYQLLQDSAFDIEAYLQRKFARRIGVAVNAHLTTGTGTGQPTGVVTGAASGKVGNTGQTTSIIYDDIVDLIHSVDPAYRNGAQFMFHDSTLKALKKIKDSQNRPLWLPGLAVREPDTIDGYPYVINQDVAVMAANAKSVLFGDFSLYFIRDVRGTQVLRLEERYAEFLQVAFLAFERHDGILVDAGQNPVKYYANSAT